MAAGALVLALMIGGFACRRGDKAANKSQVPAPAESPAGGQSGSAVAGAADAALLTRPLGFDHNRAEHKKQDCVLCHQRMDNGAEPKLPGHAACIDCHSREYTSESSRLCVVCHKVPLEAVPKPISFPAKLNQFGIKEFSHRVHSDQTKMPAGTTAPRCDACHRFDSRQLEARFPGHPECYNCHTHQAREKLAGCESCHTGQATALKFREGAGAATTMYNFKHGAHFKPASIGMNCDKCHRVLQIQAGAAQSDIQRMATPPGARHTSACWSCHVQAREPVCTKCHLAGTPL
jgi:hypothetical protein